MGSHKLLTKILQIPQISWLIFDMQRKMHYRYCIMDEQPLC